MLELNTKAPDFTLPDQNGQMHTLEEYRGKKVILYFYPKDNTPGCTKQAYDVWKEKNMYGKKTMGVVRTTYLIDEEGMIVKAFGKVKAAENPKQMLELL